MEWYSQATDQLAAATVWNYLPSGESYSEPAALASLCLLGSDRIEAATTSAAWLAHIQSPDGSVGISESESDPGWPTGLALSVWSQWQRATEDLRFAANIQSALDWALNHQGKTLPRREGIGHNTMLRGWSWALNTHAWLEPTAMFISGLHQSGQAHHPLTLEAIRMIIDRQLPPGGFNYGNTAVLGQQLLPRAQPTGVALATLAQANVDQRRVQTSVRYLQQEWPKLNSTASLCYAAIGLAAYGISVDSLDAKLLERYVVWRKRNGGIHKLALLIMASQKENCLLARKNLAQDDTFNTP